jgi:hypothetical protein
MALTKIQKNLLDIDMVLDTDNTAFGVGALTHVTSTGNSAFGVNALAALTSGKDNAAFGVGALALTTIGDNNIAISKNALALNTYGSDNFAAGKGALDASINGDANIAISTDALGANVVGDNNLAIGKSALAIATANNNIAMGVRAGNNITTGSDCIMIGTDALALTSTGSNQLNIGGLVLGDMSAGGKLWYATHPTFTVDEQIIDKKYVDDEIIANAYVLPAATIGTRGGITVGTNLTITSTGVLSAVGGALPIASVSTLGGIIVGTNLTITSTGVLSATGGSGSPITVGDYTSSTGLTSGQTLRICTNNGASGEVTLTLPTAAAALKFTFVVRANQYLRIQANTGDTIRNAGTVSASAGYFRNNVIGSVLTIMAVDTTEWVTEAIIGTWLVDS